MSEFAKIRQLEQKEAQAWEDARKKAEVIKACIFSHVWPLEIKKILNHIFKYSQVTKLWIKVEIMIAPVLTK